MQRFKGPSQRKFHTLSTKTEFKCHTIKVKYMCSRGACVW